MMENTNVPATTQLSYLALGDSYTIGEAVTQENSFPYQLVSQVGKKGILVKAPVIIAKTGWTTDELQSAISSAANKNKFDLVTLLIGVNNQYRGYPTDVYRKEFKQLLKTALDFAGGNKAHVFVVSIPDWGATPFGAGSGRDLQAVSREIALFNQINREETLAEGISYTDITPGSKLAASDASLVASDGLHPSGKMYLDWAVHVAPAVEKVFK